MSAPTARDDRQHAVLWSALPRPTAMGSRCARRCRPTWDGSLIRVRRGEPRRNYWQLVAVGMVYGVAYMAGSHACGSPAFIMPLVYLVPVVMFEERGAVTPPTGVRPSDGTTVALSAALVPTPSRGRPGASNSRRCALPRHLRPHTVSSALASVLATSLRPLAAIVYVPLLMVFRTLMYFDARARQEAFDLQVRVPSAEGA